MHSKGMNDGLQTEWNDTYNPSEGIVWTYKSLDLYAHFLCFQKLIKKKCASDGKRRNWGAKRRWKLNVMLVMHVMLGKEEHLS